MPAWWPDQYMEDKLAATARMTKLKLSLLWECPVREAFPFDIGFSDYLVSSLWLPVMTGAILLHACNDQTGTLE